MRVGQFYTPLGYENYDISPATLETVDFSNIVYRMACRNPYEYNLVDYGRDLGIMFIGDAFDSGKASATCTTTWPSPTVDPVQGRQQPVEGHLRQPDGPSVQVLQHQGYL